MAKKFGLKFDGLAELSEQYEKLGGDLKKITEEALEFIPGEINPELKKAMTKHQRTGATAKSIVENRKVEWSGTRASIAVGFNVGGAGFPSIFLMYGTPRHAPANQYGGPVKSGAQDNPGIKQDKTLYNAIYGSKMQKAIAEQQKKIFLDAVEKIIGG